MTMTGIVDLIERTDSDMRYARAVLNQTSVTRYLSEHPELSHRELIVMLRTALDLQTSEEVVYRIFTRLMAGYRREQWAHLKRR